MAGKFKPSKGAAACDLCEAGKYVIEAAATTAAMCQDCHEYSASLEGSNSRAACGCNAGYTRTNGSHTCTPCSPSQYKGWVGNEVCAECPAGSRADGPETGCVCQDADARLNGSFVPSLSECVCNAGFTGRGDLELCSRWVVELSARSDPCLWVDLSARSDPTARQIGSRVR